MDWWSKSKRWIVAHKNWLAMLVMFVISYLLGKKANQNYLEMANLAKDQYKKDNEAIVREQRLKEMRDRRAKKKADTAKKELEKERDERLKELEKKTNTPDDVFGNIGIIKK